MQPTEADSEIEEEHLLNFVVNNLGEELAIDLGEDVEVTTETLYEVLAGASAGGTSINHVCETTDDSPHANTVRGHLTDQFDLDTVEAVGDTLLQRDALETLPDRPVEVCADLHLNPDYGDEDVTEEYTHSCRIVKEERDGDYSQITPESSQKAAVKTSWGLSDHKLLSIRCVWSGVQDTTREVGAVYT